MNETVLIGFQVLGLTGLVAGVLASVRNRRDRSSRVGRVVAVAVGAVLAVLSVFVTYSFDETHRIVGFPFMAAAWEKSGTQWIDFVGPLTLPAYVGNGLFALLFPQLVVRVWRWRAPRDTRR